MTAVASFATLTQARLWQEVAAASQKRRSRPPEIAENALLAAVIALGEAGQYRQVGTRVWRARRSCRSRPRATKHYARARGRYRQRRTGDRRRAAARAPAPRGGLPRGVARRSGGVGAGRERRPGLRRHRARSEPVVGGHAPSRDAGAPLRRSRSRRRRPRASALPAAEACSRLAEQLALVELYTILSPLEHMFRRPEPQVRAGGGRGAVERSFTSAPSSPCARRSSTATARSARAPRRRWKSCASPTRSIRWRASYRERNDPVRAPRPCARSRGSTPWRPPRCCSASSSTRASRALGRRRGA